MIDQLIAQPSDQNPIQEHYQSADQEPAMTQTSPVLVTRDEFEITRCLQRVDRGELHILRRDVDKMKETIRNLTVQNTIYQNMHADLLGKLIAVGKRTKHLENVVGEQRLRVGRLKSSIYSLRNGSQTERDRSRSRTRGRHVIQRRSRSLSPLRIL